MEISEARLDKSVRTFQAEVTVCTKAKHGGGASNVQRITCSFVFQHIHFDKTSR